MKDEDPISKLFGELDPVEPGASFLRGLREIPLHYPRSEAPGRPSFWAWASVSLGLAAALALGVAAGNTDLVRSPNEEIAAFINLDGSESAADLGFLE